MSMSGKQSQSDRFKQAARELGVDEADDALDRVMGKLDLKRKPEAKEQKNDK
ncbi:hypothetical protein [Paragemmobacter ruber]|uniref:DUF3008 family protein n=1 Tax=Paragemmobacter ruber TaxID=1985673 RepID=A0ABW9Y6U2_9RHOB|nr:hypothetical protein [Rhodobacter ruber]NBE08118.1 hypothetical protein [Rhodobacter ruber]